MFSADLAVTAISKIREQLSLYVEKVPFSPGLRVQIQHMTLCRLLFWVWVFSFVLIIYKVFSYE